MVKHQGSDFSQQIRVLFGINSFITPQFSFQGQNPIPDISRTANFTNGVNHLSRVSC